MIVLSNVKIHLVAGGDGLDSNSTLFFELYLQDHSGVRNIADYKLGNTGINPHDVYDHVLDLHDNTLQKENINNTIFYLEINAVGHDKIDANLTVEFGFSDGTVISWPYGIFEIGTYHMSNSTRKQVQLQQAHELQNITLPEKTIEAAKVPIQFTYILYINGDWENKKTFTDGTSLNTNGHLSGHPVHGDVKFKESIFYNDVWVDRSLLYY